MERRQYDDLPDLPGRGNSGTKAQPPSLPYRIGSAINKPITGAATAITRPLVEPIIREAPKVVASATGGIADFARGLVGAAPRSSAVTTAVQAAPGPSTTPVHKRDLQGIPPIHKRDASSARQAGDVPVPGFLQETTPGVAERPAPGPSITAVAPPLPNSSPPSPAAASSGKLDISNPHDAALISQSVPAYEEYLAQRGLKQKGPIVINGEFIQGSPSDIRAQGIRHAKALFDHTQGKAVPGASELLAAPDFQKAGYSEGTDRLDQMKADLLQQIIEADGGAGATDRAQGEQGTVGDQGAIQARKARLTALYKELFGERSSTAPKLYAKPVYDQYGAQTGETPYLYDAEGVRELKLPGAAEQVGQAPAAAIEKLRQNPKLASAFKQKYGYLPEGF